jgi:conjugal transfer pilus assembly protein TraI
MALTLPTGNAYPSADPGFGSTSVEDLLASNDDLISRIRLCFGIDRNSFDRDVLVLLRRYAACVHLLLATKSTASFSRKRWFA